MREKFEDDFAHGFKDRVVENARLVITDTSISIPVVRELVLDSLTYFAEGVVLVFIAQAVDFMEKDFEVDAWVVFGEEDCCSEEFADAREVLILTIDDPDHGANTRKDSSEVVVRGVNLVLGGYF